MGARKKQQFFRGAAGAPSPWQPGPLDVEGSWELVSEIRCPEDRGPLAFLEQTDPVRVVSALAAESPVDAAGVLGALNPGYADLVLQLMSAADQETVVNLLQEMPMLLGDEQIELAERLRQRLGIRGGGKTR